MTATQTTPTQTASSPFTGLWPANQPIGLRSTKRSGRSSKSQRRSGLRVTNQPIGLRSFV